MVKMSETINFISVVVPCLNSENTVEKCIHSLLEQNYPSDFCEIIFVDNGSKDKTIDIIKKYPVQLLIENEKNPYVARNKGAVNSRGQVLAFTDSNCEADKNWLSAINDYINRGVEVSQGPGFLTKQKEIIPRAECNQWIMKDDDFWGDGKNIALLKSVFMKVGGFPTHYTGGDSLIVYKLKTSGYNVRYNENQKVYREFSTKFSVLLKKNWKYGKGDIAIDLFNNRLDREKKYILCMKSFLRFFIKIPEAKNPEDLFISNFYYHTMKITRSISYIVNYKLVLNKCKDIDGFTQVDRPNPQ